MSRKGELAANLAAVGARIAAAAEAAGRDAHDIRLVAVSKTFPAQDVVLLRELGHRDFGESRHQDAAPKAAAVADATRSTAGHAAGDLRWHFLGQLQRNKVRAVARYTDVLHSFDRAELLDPLRRAVADRGRPMTVLVQVDLDGSDPGRGGAVAKDVPALANAIAETEGLVLGGVMAVAPRAGEPRKAFAQLREVAERLQREHLEAGTISAGMSQDLEAAIAEGSTVVRVGTALFGSRGPGLG